jgi:hypothetical protein
LVLPRTWHGLAASWRGVGPLSANDAEPVNRPRCSVAAEAILQSGRVGIQPHPDANAAHAAPGPQVPRRHGEDGRGRLVSNMSRSAITPSAWTGEPPCSPWSSALPPCESKTDGQRTGRGLETTGPVVRPGRPTSCDRAIRGIFDSHGGSAEDHGERRSRGLRLVPGTEGRNDTVPVRDAPAPAASRAAHQS